MHLFRLNFKQDLAWYPVAERYAMGHPGREPVEQSEAGHIVGADALPGV